MSRQSSAFLKSLRQLIVVMHGIIPWFPVHCSAQSAVAVSLAAALRLASLRRRPTRCFSVQVEQRVSSGFAGFGQSLQRPNPLADRRFS